MISDLRPKGFSSSFLSKILVKKEEEKGQGVEGGEALFCSTHMCDAFHMGQKWTHACMRGMYILMGCERECIYLWGVSVNVYTYGV